MIQNHKINFKTIFIKKNTHKNRKFIIFEKKKKRVPKWVFFSTQTITATQKNKG